MSSKREPVSDFIAPTNLVMRSYYHDFTSRIAICVGAASTGKSRLTLAKCLLLPRKLCKLRQSADYGSPRDGKARIARIMLIRETNTAIKDNVVPLMREAFPPEIRLDETAGMEDPKMSFDWFNPDTRQLERHVLLWRFVGLNEPDAHNRHRGGNYDAIVLSELEKLHNRAEGVQFLFTRIGRNVNQSDNPIVFGDTNPVADSHFLWNWIPKPSDEEIDARGHEQGYIKEKSVDIDGVPEIRRMYHSGNQLAAARKRVPLANPVTPPSYYISAAQGFNENDRRKNLEGKLPLSDHEYLVFPSFGRAHKADKGEFKPGKAVYAGADTDTRGAIVLSQWQDGQLIVPADGVLYADGRTAQEMGKVLARFIREHPTLNSCQPGGLWADPAGSDRTAATGQGYTFHLNESLGLEGFANWSFAPAPFIFGRKENSGQGRASYAEPMLQESINRQGEFMPVVQIADARLQEALSEYHYSVSWNNAGQEIKRDPVKDKHSGPAEAFAYLCAGLISEKVVELELGRNLGARVASITDDGSGEKERQPSVVLMHDPNRPLIVINPIGDPQQDANSMGYTPQQSAPDSVTQL